MYLCVSTPPYVLYVHVSVIHQTDTQKSHLSAVAVCLDGTLLARVDVAILIGNSSYSVMHAVMMHAGAVSVLVYIAC